MSRHKEAYVIYYMMEFYAMTCHDYTVTSLMNAHFVNPNSKTNIVYYLIKEIVILCI